MARFFPFVVVALCFTSAVQAQRTTDNAVTAAEDAFGATIGNESVGLYSVSQVRGFSPISAGNIRIEGIYFDRRGGMPPQLVQGSRIRVGLTAQSYPFPAPTGIVDYQLQKAGDKQVLSVYGGLAAYTAPFVQVDAKLPLIPEKLGVAGGVSYALEEYYDGADAGYVRVGFVPRWQPKEGIEILPFWSMVRGRDEEVAPTIITSGSHNPPEIERRNYFGQSWAANETKSENLGLIGKAQVGKNWAVSGGVFRSSFHTLQGFADLYLDTSAEGIARELVIADPPQAYVSESWEISASRALTEGPRLHVLHVKFRGRRQDNLYGGSADAVELAPRPLGTTMPVPEPATFAFSERTRDAVDQLMGGISYEGRWRNVGEASVGIQKTDYEKTTQQPALPSVTSRDKPWLIYATAAAHILPTFAVYAGYSEGLEETGIAPDYAANRNEALPAIRTRQVDAGIRWTFAPEWKLVAGLFDVRKPYFTTNLQNVFTATGNVRHQGMEVSLSAKPVEKMTLLAGAVLMDPRVTGEAVDEGRVGRRPVGQSRQMYKGNLEYRFSGDDGWSVDAGFVSYGKRAASRAGDNFAPGYNTVDIGFRYRFMAGNAPAVLRGQISNITDTFAWYVMGNNSFGLIDGRRASLTLAVDF